MKASISSKLEHLAARHEEVAALLADAETISDQDRFRKLSMEYAQNQPVVRQFEAYREAESARAQAESASALVAAASKTLEIARLNVSYTELRADDECSIASLDIEVNENVAAGQQVAVVSCGDAFEVTLDLPESLIGSVDETTPVSIRFGAIPDQVFSGVISEVAVASAAGSAAFPIVIKIEGSHPSLRSGLAADVTFQFDSASDQGSSVVLPVTAVINDPNGTFVFIVTPAEVNGEALVGRRAVALGELSQSGIEVVDGLEVGDRVITAGISVIREGQRVLIPNSR